MLISKKTKQFFLILLLAVISNSGIAQPAINLASRDRVPGELLVQFKSETSIHAKALIEKRTKIKNKIRFANLGFEHWILKDPSELDITLQTLNSDPNIEFAEPNYRRYPRALPKEGSSSLLQAQLRTLNQINVPKVWDLMDNASKLGNVTVAVIDDGFNIDHLDFRSSTDITNINLTESRDFVDNDADPRPGNCPDATLGGENHGTEIAGIIGARTDNGYGISGIPWNVNLIVYRVGCEYSTAAESKAIDAAIAANVNVINASYGGAVFSSAESAAIRRLQGKGILFVAASGNGELNNDIVADYPSGLDIPNIISVAASETVDKKTRLTDWSQYGATNVDVAAPGVDIVSFKTDGSIDFVGVGTSFSAAIVSGVAALLVKATHSNTMTYRDIKGALIASAVPMQENLPHLASGGQIDANAAFKLLIDPISDPVPVIVIHEIKFVDDPTTGDGDNQIDVDETGQLEITIENIWKDATNLTLTLSSDALTSPVIQTLSTIRSEERAPISFRINKPLLTKDEHRRVLFKLKIDGSGPSAKSFTYTRAFNLELGELRRDNMVKANIKALSDEQDEIHLYNFDVPSGLSEVTVELIVNGVFSTPLSLLVKRGSPPQFEYGDTLAQLTADDETKVALAQQAAKSSITSDYSTQIKLEKPTAGTYFAVVTAQTDKRNIEYHLSMTYPRRTIPPRGCSSSIGLSVKPEVDPTLLLLLLLSLIYTFKKRRVVE